MIIVTGPGSNVLSQADFTDIIERWSRGEAAALPAEYTVEFLDTPLLSHWTPKPLDCISLATVEYSSQEAHL